MKLKRIGWRSISNDHFINFQKKNNSPWVELLLEMTLWAVWRNNLKAQNDLSILQKCMHIYDFLWSHLNKRQSLASFSAVIKMQIILRANKNKLFLSKAVQITSEICIKSLKAIQRDTVDFSPKKDNFSHKKGQICFK